MERKHRRFTLLEVMVTLSVLSLCLGVFLFASPRLFVHHSFDYSVKSFEEIVESAQYFSRRFDLPLQVRVSVQNGRCHVQIIPPSSFPEKWQRYLSKSKELKSIREIIYDEMRVESFDLDIYPRQFITNKPNLKFRNGSIEKTISFSNFKVEEGCALVFPQANL